MTIGMERIIIAIFGIVAVFVFLILLYRHMVDLVVSQVARGAISGSRIDQPTNQGFEVRQVQPRDPFHRGLDPSVIAKLPIYVYEKRDQLDDKDTRECVICLSSFEEEEIAVILPNCTHLFHAQCINMWFSSHSTCPICRCSAEPKEKSVCWLPFTESYMVGRQYPQLNLGDSVLEKDQKGEFSLEC